MEQAKVFLNRYYNNYNGIIITYLMICPYKLPIFLFISLSTTLVYPTTPFTAAAVSSPLLYHHCRTGPEWQGREHNFKLKRPSECMKWLRRHTHKGSGWRIFLPRLHASKETHGRPFRHPHRLEAAHINTANTKIRVLSEPAIAGQSNKILVFHSKRLNKIKERPCLTFKTITNTFL